jgi:hypothetical protein
MIERLEAANKCDRISREAVKTPAFTAQATMGKMYNKI